MSIFRPKEKLNIFTDLDIPAYREKGFDTVLLDVDNTIAVPNTGSCDDRARKFIEDLKAAGFKVVIFSNNNEKRVKMFLGDMDTDYWHLA
jgi:HAD superfamily phosphatase (TIGR01668 family)